MFNRTWVGAATSMAVLGGLGMSSCSLAGGPDDPGDAARAFASALSARDVSKSPMVFDARTTAVDSPAQAQNELDAIVRGMGDVDPEVTLRGVRQLDVESRATADLQTVWPAPGGSPGWTYTIQVPMQWKDREWRVSWSPAVVAPDLAAGEVLRSSRTAAGRAPITGDGGTPLVSDRKVWRIGIDRSTVGVDQAGAAARSLAKALDVDAKEYERRVTSSGPKAFVEALVVRQEGGLPASTLRAVDAVKGARRLAEKRPLAPTREFARALLGVSGEATAEIVEGSKGRVRPGDIVGLSGLQRTYDSRLRGVPGLEVHAVKEGADGPESARVVYSRPATDGKPLALTLNSGMQKTAEERLAEVESPAGLVAIRPSTGEVLVAASSPASKGYSTSTVGQYPPGSTFKIVTALALLRSGQSIDGKVSCPVTTTVDGAKFKNFDDYPAGQNGSIPFRSAIAHSCNTALIELAGKADQGRLAQAAAALGLTQVQDGLPGFIGAVPASAGSTEHAASMIGQGKVLASPLGMATVAASVAKGKLVSPYLVAEARTTPPAVSVPLTPAEAGQLKRLLRAVVTEGGASFLQDVPGAPVEAKTGTAEYGSDVPPKTHAWMIAVQGDLAVSVFVEKGQFGSVTAGPIMADFLTVAHALTQGE